jgi:sugar phosphate isomerase/epimerase
MWKVKLCLNLIGNSGIQTKELVRLYRRVGFEGFFVNWSEDTDLKELRECSDTEGMLFQSVHAPYLKAADMWRGGEAARIAKEELFRCLEDTAEIGVELVICHTWIGFNTGEKPNEVGIESYRSVVEKARELNIKIAFENTEGEEFLHAILDAFKGYRNVGFCWDSGHEMCYNRSKDMLALYGDRLFSTHLNDNLGIKDYGGNITYLDDLHLLPFDGICDWNDAARRLTKCGYGGELTFELTTVSKRGRHENDVYAEMGIERYITEVYKRACRVATLISSKKESEI